LERSVSVLLPVRNRQSTLAAQVQRTLEVLSDASVGFQLIIIDDGSTDATIEVADELASYYPQVTALRHAEPLGREASIRTGLAQTTGQVVLLEDDEGLQRIDPARFQRGGGPAAAPPTRTDSPQHGPSAPQRPNYLTRLKEFTLGE